MSGVMFLLLWIIHKTLPTVFKGTLALQYLWSDTRRSGYKSIFQVNLFGLDIWHYDDKAKPGNFRLTFLLNE